MPLVSTRAGKRRCLQLTGPLAAQLDQEGVPPTTIREVSLLKVLSRSNHVVKCGSALTLVHSSVTGQL